MARCYICDRAMVTAPRYLPYPICDRAHCRHAKKDLINTMAREHLCRSYEIVDVGSDVTAVDQ